MAYLNVFASCVQAIRDGILIVREHQRDKEYHFQNWFRARLEHANLNFDQLGRNAFPDFALVQPPVGFEVKGLAYPGREVNYDCNSQVPSGHHNGREIFYVFGRYPANPDGDEYPVLDLVICHGDFLNADHNYVHRNRSVRGFGSYGDSMIRDRKMYVAPTPFGLTTGTVHNHTLILPEQLQADQRFQEVGQLDRKPEVHVVCPECAGIFAADVNDEESHCPHCQHDFDLHSGPASGASATCRKCRCVFPIAKTAKAIGHPPSHRMFAKLVLNGSGEKLYLPVTRKDELAYQRCSEELHRSKLPLPTLELKDGYNTRQALNYAYRYWREFFNDRQLLALGWLHAAILELPDDAARAALRTVFSGVLEFNNMFASYKGEGTGAIRHMFAHHILKPERVPIEGNVWGTSKSSGSFSTLFKSRLLRAIEYRSAPFELEIERKNGSSNGKRMFGGSSPFAGRVETKWPPSPKKIPRAIHLSCGSSSSTGLANASVDLVVTDPPFFDNVHYSELADFFFAWQQLGPSPFVGTRTTTRHAEEVQDTSAEQFAAKLRAVFAECCRVLREDGLLVFTYHHSRMDGWTSLADAVVGAGFSLVNCHPVKSEMSVAAPKSQAKEPIQLDIVMVCQKRMADTRKKGDAKIAFLQAVQHATSKAGRLKKCGLTLSVNDRRVILISQFLVETCAGRSAEQLSETLLSNLTELDLASMRLLDSQTIQSAMQTNEEERQLTLLEKPTTERPASPVNYRQAKGKVRKVKL